MNRETIKVELVIIFVLLIVIFILAGHYDIMERIVAYSRQHEQWQMDELIAVSIGLVFLLALFSIRRWREAVDSERRLIQRNEELQDALSEIKQLRGIISICSACKKIRDNQGFWQHVEVYIRDHSEAEFSHGICPDCINKLYPDVVHPPY